MTTPNIIRESARGFDLIRIEDALLESREVFLTDTVDTDTMTSLLKQLLYLSRQDPDAEITLYINSPGGNVDSGLAIYDFLKSIPAPILTVCIGEAASMDAVLFLAGDRRVMFPHSRIMIHDPSFGNGLGAGMKPDELEERLEDLKKARDTAVQIISSVTGKTEDEIREKTRKDSWFDAEDALAFGLATEVISDETIDIFTTAKKGA